MNRRVIVSLLCLSSMAAQAWCGETPSTLAGDAPAVPAVNASDLEALKQRIAEQQEQIRKLQQAMEEQQKLLDRSLQKLTTSSTSKMATGDGTAVVEASTTKVVGPVRLVPAVNLGGRPNPLVSPAPQAADSGNSNPCERENAGPTYIRLGNTCVIPIGFMDLTGLWRDKNAGSSIGTNFGGVPYNNTTNAQNSEFRFSPQNSRLGVRVDGDWKGAHFIGYNEFDFLGTGGGTNYTVTNGAFVPRLRLFWVDVTKGKVEFLAGQSWSMLTPNRRGISPLPGDIFYSQVMDVNYMAGLTWTRQPGMRVLFHPNSKATFGLAVENPDQYIGGSAGGSGITLPSALASLGSAQLDNAPNIGTANTVLAVPTVSPDIIAKIAFDPSSRFHFEVGGIERQFRIWNPNTGSAPGAGQHFSATGAGLLAGLNAEVFKGFRLITSNFLSDGGGRYLFGQAPDVVVRANGSLSPVHASGTVDGFEATVKNTLLFAYYGGIYIGRDVALDANGTSKIGYGYAGSPNSQNRAIQEGTLGFNQIVWKNPKYGAINLIGQYEYMTRNPWSVALGSPKSAHDNTVYFDVRYTLPGSMPNF
jgi:hypothetical protein